MKNSIELLAPAGSYEAFIAAVQNGANAVYLGGNAFGARAYATNFSDEEIIRAVKYAHLRNVRVYITVNTLYDDLQFPELLEYLTFLYDNQVDALIIQDVGLVEMVKHYFPDFEIHMSTQTSIHNLEGVTFFEELGIQRVVLSRENTIDEIRDICQHTTIDIEVFVHGALCVSYSGQCLMSSSIGKRSGNKGMCAQPCRLGYRLKKDNQYLNNKELYLLSPRDLCTIENIDTLIEAGITSFKIEGRMKRPEYVAVIVKKYRQAIDQYLTTKNIQDQKDTIIAMKKMFNRGFTNGYLFNDATFMSKTYPGNRGVEVGSVINYDFNKRKVRIKLNDTLKQNDRIVFENNDFTRTITKLYNNGCLVNRGDIGDVIEIDLDTKVFKNNTVYKVIDDDLLIAAKNSYRDEHCKIPITIAFKGTIGKQANITISDGSNIIEKETTHLVEKAISKPLTKERLEQQLQKVGGTVYSIKDITIDYDKEATLPIKEVNLLRREAIESLNVIRENKKIHSHKIETTLSLKKHSINNKTLAIKVCNLSQLEIVASSLIGTYYFPIGKELKEAIAIVTKLKGTIIPYTSFLTTTKTIQEFIESSEFQMIDTVLIGDFGALQLLKNYKKCILDTSFNIYNSYATSFFKEYQGIILSNEMSAKQIKNLHSQVPEVIFMAYGKVENMISKYCPISEHYFDKKVVGCNRCKEGKYSLVDRKKESFTICMDESCNMHLLNNHPLYIDKIDSLPVSTILLSFSDEDNNTIKAIVNDYITHILPNNKSQNKTNVQYTNGYFND